MAITIGRRQFIARVAGAAFAWPLAARAQQPAMPVIGFLHSTSPEPLTHILAGFRQGLNETGYIEGQNVAVEYRWARGQYDRLPAMATELSSAEFLSSWLAAAKSQRKPSRWQLRQSRWSLPQQAIP
jgi:hypothetical protein